MFNWLAAFLNTAKLAAVLFKYQLPRFPGVFTPWTFAVFVNLVFRQKVIIDVLLALKHRDLLAMFSGSLCGKGGKSKGPSKGTSKGREKRKGAMKSDLIYTSLHSLSLSR